MSYARRSGALGTLALLAGMGNAGANAQQIKTVFVIAMENHNWTQPANQFTGGIQQIFQNPNAPFINSLVDGSAFAVIGGSLVHISEHVAYASNYHSVLATPNGNNPHIHPSEPNYIWAEAGTNFGVLNDRDPFAAAGPTNQDTPLHLTGLLQDVRLAWRRRLRLDRPFGLATTRHRQSPAFGRCAGCCVVKIYSFCHRVSFHQQ